MTAGAKEKNHSEMQSQSRSFLDKLICLLVVFSFVGASAQVPSTATDDDELPIKKKPVNTAPAKPNSPATPATPASPSVSEKTDADGNTVISVDVKEVLLSAIVRNNGRIVGQLPASAFRVVDEGVTKTAHLLEAEKIPGMVGYVFDLSPSMDGLNWSMLQNASVRFAKTLLRKYHYEDAQYAYGFAATTQRLMNATYNVNQLIRLITQYISPGSLGGGTAIRDGVFGALTYISPRYNPRGMTGSEAEHHLSLETPPRSLQGSGSSGSVNAPTASGAAWDPDQEAQQTAKGAPTNSTVDPQTGETVFTVDVVHKPRRYYIVVFSDGDDNMSGVSYAQLEQLAREQEAMIFSIQIGDSSSGGLLSGGGGGGVGSSTAQGAILGGAIGGPIGAGVGAAIGGVVGLKRKRSQQNGSAGNAGGTSGTAGGVPAPNGGTGGGSSGGGGVLGKIFRNEDVLGNLANLTGGSYQKVKSPQDLDQAVQDVANAMNSHYTLSFAGESAGASAGSGGKSKKNFRRVQVQVDQWAVDRALAGETVTDEILANRTFTACRTCSVSHRQSYLVR